LGVNIPWKGIRKWGGPFGEAEEEGDGGTWEPIKKGPSPLGAEKMADLRKGTISGRGGGGSGRGVEQHH